MARKPVREQRRLSAVKAQMRVEDNLTEITISNVSAGGLMAKCADPPPTGTVIEILRRGMRIEGKVVWSLGRRFGMSAAKPIDLGELFAESGLSAKTGAVGAPVTKSWWHWSRKR